MSTWVGSAGTYTTASAPVSVTLPAGWQPGDLAILVVSSDSNVDQAWPAPSGWTYLTKTAAGNMHSYLWYRVLQAGDTTVGMNLGSGTFTVGVWRDAVIGTVGAFGIRSGTIFTTTSPNIAATGYRAHIFAERSTAAVAGEADTLHTLAYGNARAFYPGNLTVGAANGISAAYFSDSAPGQSGDNTATFKDSSSNSWGIQIDLGAGALPVPVASFTADKTSIVAGEAVQFTDTSTNTPTSWSWNFGAGGPAGVTTKSPLVTFPTAGSYNVVLTATNASGSGVSSPTTIVVSPAPTSGPITVQAIGTVNSTSGGAGAVLTLQTPAGATIGNYLVAVCTGQIQTADDFVPPAGWVRLNTPHLNDVGTRMQSMFGFPLNAAPAASYGFTVGAATPTSGRLIGFIVSLNNVDLVNPLIGYSPYAKSQVLASSLSVPQYGGDNFLMEVWSAQFASPHSYALSSYTGGLTLRQEGFNPAGAENTGVSRTALRLWCGQPGALGNPAHAILTTGSSAAQAVSQISLKSGGVTPPTGMPIKVSDGTQLKDSRLQVSDGTKLYTPRGIKKVKPGYATVTAMLATRFYCAHRGGSRDWPEMSAFAYGQSVLQDYGALELSLARTSDGVWFGLHDQYLDRTSLGNAAGTTLNPASMTWAQVQGYQILGSMAANNPTQPNRPYMRFEELMAVYYDSHIIFADIKYASAYTTEFLDKLDALPGNPRERIVGKSYGVSGPANNSSGFAKAFADRGYQTWGYFYETDQANFATYAGRWTFLGMDYGGSQASWDALKAAGPGKLIMGHICPDVASVNTALTKGASGLMVSSPINVRST